ncbi:MAG: hypothetical protein EDM03_05670 [Porphyrobacter sp. IPPAS B-1204]|nr:MAG: hypothetical protein EDM03_05670 [Porphyrobacter sp. IPPAS B-1204]
MSEPLITDWLTAGAALCTLLTAVVAVYFAAKAPKKAAEWAEKYRRQSEQASEREKLRMQVFVALMKCRSQLLHQDALAALNLVDVAFSDVPAVREAYRSFHDATGEDPSSAEKIIERYHALIDKVSQAVGMADQISVSDIRAGYYPLALGRLDEAALAEAEAKIANAKTKPSKRK